MYVGVPVYVGVASTVKATVPLVGWPSADTTRYETRRRWVTALGAESAADVTGAVTVAPRTAAVSETAA